MKKTIQSILLSGLVFPGLGQIFLGNKKAGIGLIIGTNIGIAGILYGVIRRVPAILAQIQPEIERGNLDIKSLADLSIQASNNSSNFLDKASLVIIVGCWIVGIAHSYWQGRQQSKSTKASSL